MNSSSKSSGSALFVLLGGGAIAGLLYLALVPKPPAERRLKIIDSETGRERELTYRPGRR